jgi:hypothetical protein
MDATSENLDLDLDINEMIKNALTAALSSLQIGYLNKIGIQPDIHIRENVDNLAAKQVAKLFD